MAGTKQGTEIAELGRWQAALDVAERAAKFAALAKTTDLQVGAWDDEERAFR